MKLTTLNLCGEEPIAGGGMVTACAVSGANVLRDMREAITNTLGGQMTRYKKVLQETVDRALEALADRATAEGYDGVIGVQISHPMITEGAIEVVVSGTGYRRERGVG